MKVRKLERRSVLVIMALMMVMTILAGTLSSHHAMADKIVDGQKVTDPTPAPTPKQETKTVQKKDHNLIQFQSRQLKIDKAFTGTVDWTSSNANVCTVSDTGYVQARGVGSCVIQAMFFVNTATSNTKYYYRWNFNVSALRLNETKLTLLQRRKGFYLKLNNGDAASGDSWTSSRPSVASVNKNGYVHPKNPGTTTVSVTWNGVTLSCDVKVKEVNTNSLRQLRNPKYKSNRGKVVLAGGGILDHWTNVYKAFGSTTVINNAVPYSTFSNWNAWAKNLIIEYRPKAVVFCIGTEEIGNGGKITGKECADRMKKLIQKVHGTKRAKSAKLFVVSTPMNPWKDGAWDEIKEYNSLMKDYCSSRKYVTYLDLNKELMDGDQPDETFFVEDHTYLSGKGYSVMKNVVVKKVRKAIR
jgi:lysophospholipase L1-like esterase